MNLRSGLQMPEKSTFPSGVRGVAAAGRADPRPVVLMASPCPAAFAALNAHAATATAATVATATRVFIMTSSFFSSGDGTGPILLRPAPPLKGSGRCDKLLAGTAAEYRHPRL